MITKVINTSGYPLKRLVKHRASTPRHLTIGGIYQVSAHPTSTAFYVYAKDHNIKGNSNGYLAAEYKDCFMDAKEFSECIDIKTYVKISNNLLENKHKKETQDERPK